ncbi:MAG: zinc ribbon domain-containing protein [Pyrinomonadaceae bacterium]
MFCPSCGNEITVELKYCNRCGANLSLPSPSHQTPVMLAPVKLGVPSIVMGLTIIAGLGIIFGGASQFARVGMHPAAITWIVLFSSATLFGCVALMIRFWTRMMTSRPEVVLPQAIRPSVADRGAIPAQLPPGIEGIPSVTEHTTRTFTPAYREPSDRGAR